MKSTGEIVLKMVPAGILHTVERKVGKTPHVSEVECLKNNNLGIFFCCSEQHLFLHDVARIVISLSSPVTNFCRDAGIYVGMS